MIKFLKRLFLLADYKLRNQDITGVNVIEKGGMKDRHIIVTNAYLSDMKGFKEKEKYIKVFNKMYLNDINLRVN